MSKFYAEIEDGIVINVVIAEKKKDLYSAQKWVETFVDGSKRAHHASIGGFYDSENDVFYAEKPYDSWTLNKTKWIWEAPKAQPEDGKDYIWNETDGEWKEAANGGMS